MTPPRSSWEWRSTTTVRCSDGFRTALAGLEADGVVVVTAADDRADLDRLVADGDVDAGFHLAAGFSDDVQSAQGAVITVVGDPGAPLATDVAEAIAGTFGAELDYVTLATASVLMAEGAVGDAAPNRRAVGGRAVATATGRARAESNPTAAVRTSPRTTRCRSRCSSSSSACNSGS